MMLQNEELLDTNEAAELLKLKPNTLTRMRSEGRGPVYYKAGRMPRYRLADIAAWLESRKVAPSAGE